MKLQELLNDSKIILPEEIQDLEITQLDFDSRHVIDGSIFFCRDGLVVDGHDFVDKAIENGAKCIIHSKEIENKQKGIVYLKVDDVLKYLNMMAKTFYHDAIDDLYAIGITGTNGKTTIGNIIHQILSNYMPCGYIGTLGAKYGDIQSQPTLTTPDAIELHQTFELMKQAGMKAVALEASSQGLAQSRCDSVKFKQAIFTNLTYDHMDYHVTVENYLQSKKRLFDLLDEDGIAIINIDDEKAMDIVEGCKGKIITYGMMNDATYKAEDVVSGVEDSTFTLVYQERKIFVRTNLIARYNIYNLLAAIASMHQAGMPLEAILERVNCISQIEGRMESIEEGQNFRVYVDFAHTPDGLEKVFTYAKSITPVENRIIAVFGSAGKRDIDKRKIFGELADLYCDHIILTEDDPRNEDPKAIAVQIQEGIKQKPCIFIENRYDAIRAALDLANPNDCVLLLGKGDESFLYREFGKEAWLGDDKAARHIIQKYILNENMENN